VIVNWIEMAIGIWILASPWILGFQDVALGKWSNVILGLVVIVLNTWIVFGEKAEKNIKPTS